MSSAFEDRLTAFAARIIRDGAAYIRGESKKARSDAVLVSDPLARAYVEGMLAGMDLAANGLDQWADNVIAAQLLNDLDTEGT